jgi:hypothetical protein
MRRGINVLGAVNAAPELRGLRSLRVLHHPLCVVDSAGWRQRQGAQVHHCAPHFSADRHRRVSNLGRVGRGEVEGLAVRRNQNPLQAFFRFRWLALSDLQARVVEPRLVRYCLALRWGGRSLLGGSDCRATTREPGPEIDCDDSDR